MRDISNMPCKCLTLYLWSFNISLLEKQKSLCQTLAFINAVEIAAETHRKPGAVTDQQTAHTHTHTIALPLLHVHYLAMQSYQYPGRYGFIVGINL